MSDKDDRLTQSSLQRKKFALQFVTRERIECAERFVHQKNRGIGREGPRHADALSLPPGKLSWVARSQLRFEADDAQ
jgi:hypothetical protein